MRQVEHYVGEEITTDVIEKINLMAMKRYEEGVFCVLYEGVDTLEELCFWHDALRHEENVVLGEDWVIIYVKRQNEIELVEWLDVEDVPDKFTQTMEMMKAMKNILLESEGKRLIADMRHDTSYQFYQLMLKRGFFECGRDNVSVEENAPRDVFDFSKRVIKQYGSLDDYFACGERESIEEYEKYFYHALSFKVTEKFVKKYKK